MRFHMGSPTVISVCTVWMFSASGFKAGWSHVSEFFRDTVRQRDKNRHIKKREIQRENCNYGQTAVGPSMKGSPCDSLRFKMLSHKGFIGTKIGGAAPVSGIFALFFFFFYPFRHSSGADARLHNQEKAEF